MTRAPLIGTPFKPGKSGNPGGRPAEVAVIKDLIRAKGPDLIEQLMRLALTAETEARTRIEAIRILLDRGYGKPAQTVAAEDGGSAHLQVTWLTPGSA